MPFNVLRYVFLFVKMFYRFRRYVLSPNIEFENAVPTVLASVSSRSAQRLKEEVDGRECEGSEREEY